MITPDELEYLIKRMIARYKLRSFDEFDAADWADAAQDGRWTHAASMRALREHMRDPESRPPSPAHIDATIRKMRGRAVESFREPDQPDGMPNGEYLTLCQRARAAHVDRLLSGWAETGHMPQNAIEAGTEVRAIAASPAGQVHVQELLSGAFQTIAEEKAVTARQRRERSEETRSRIVAELDAVRRRQEADATRDAVRAETVA